MTGEPAPLIPADHVDAEAAQALFSVAAIGVAIVTPAGTMERVNPKFAAVLGYTVRELEGTSWQSITLRADVGPDEAMVADVVAGRVGSYTMYKRYVHRDGRQVPMNLQVNAIRGDDGRPRVLIAQIYAPAAQVAGDPVAAEKMRAEAKRGMVQTVLGVFSGIGFAALGAGTGDSMITYTGALIAVVAIGGVQVLDKWRSMRGGTP